MTAMKLLIICVAVNSFLAGLVHSWTDQDDTFDITLQIPNVVSPKVDDLVCTGQKLGPQESYIVAFTPLVSKSNTHHLVVYGCASANTEELWYCHGELDVCNDGKEPQILFAWALDAPEFRLPEGVGIRVGGTTGINHIVIDVHYARVFAEGETDNSGMILHLTNQRPSKQAGYYVMANSGFIPPQQKEIHIESACQFSTNYTIHPIGFRTHSHNLGVVTSAYRIRDGEWLEIGRMSPLLPQTFYPIANPGMDIRPGDVLASRCTMNSMRRVDNTIFGPKNSDEMCNFYVMYYTHYQENLETIICMDHAPDFHWSQALKDLAPFPLNASSLDGIPDSDKIRAKFQ